MKGYSVYNAIKQLKDQGFKKAAVARQLDINRRTVDRYWDMSVDEYEAMKSEVRRKQALDKYQDAILGWLKDYPSISSAQILDWLKENYDEDFSERTVSRYVRDLREEHNIRKQKNPRTYEAVPELPMGKQVQVDFGETNLKNSTGGHTKVYCAAFLLSHSRYKYAELQSRPFTASDLVRACYRCFNYYGGMPREMVFDQDSIVCVSENLGDVIYTYEFEKFRQECNMSIYMCRGADPESKGKIENTVKYIKGNFLANRIYINDEILNASCLKWLERTGNARVHGTSKRIPAEVFKEERETLRPLYDGIQLPETKICRTVRKDNTIIYDSNRYSVPFNTYNKHKEVCIEAVDGFLRISTSEGEEICEHRIHSGRGQLIQNTDHKRNKTSAVDKIQADLDERLFYQATEFLEGIRKEKARYARDQFRFIETLIDAYGVNDCLNAIDFCHRSRLYSANTVRDFLDHQAAMSSQPEPEFDVNIIPVSNAKYHVSTEKRPLDVYTKVGDQIANTY